MPRCRPSDSTALRLLAVVGAVVAVAAVSHHVVAGSGARTVYDRDNPYATKVDRHHPPSRVLFPPQALPLRFSHAKHLALEMECSACHESVDKSVRSADVNLPKGEVCSLCHEVSDESPAQADPPAACNTCHLDYEGVYEGFDPHDEPARVTRPPARVHIPPPHIHFNHKVHIDRGVACSQCHGDLQAVEVAVVENSLPVMGDCMGCHNGKEAPDACTTCHEAVPTEATRLRTSYPHGELKPHGYYRNDAHNEGFVLNHAAVARADEGYCASCHSPSYCVDCHNGVVKPVQIHPANFILTHPIPARKNSQECSSCHRQQSFCTDCHRRSGVMDLASNVSGTLSFHPAGWVNNPGEPPSPRHHMFEAQRNIRACTSCHEERSCLKCHSARDPVGFGAQRARSVNPHPPGFRDRCRAMMSLNAHACGKCHEPSDPHLALCR